MNNLLPLSNAADKPAVIETNFERVDESMAFSRTPNRINDVLTEDLGAPNAGTWPLYKCWVDALCAVFLCTAAGTPGTWAQIEPAPVTAFPAEPPNGYEVARVDEDGKLYRWSNADNDWIEMFTDGTGGGGSGSANQNVVFASEQPLITPSYLGGRFRWAVDVDLKSASIVCEAPATADISFTLEVNGALTAKVITVTQGTTSAELDLTGTSVPTGDYMRWKCTASPDAANTASQLHLSVDLTPAADAPDQNVPFDSEAPLVADSYIGGRFRWTAPASMQSASVVCEAPVGADISFTLEVNGALTAKVLTVAAGQTNAELDLTGITVPSGQYIRWKCTASPAAANTASQIHLSTNLSL